MVRAVAVLTSMLAVTPTTAVRVSGQTVPATTLTVTVADPSGAVIPGANVTVAGQEEATRLVNVGPLQTSSQGVATFRAVPQGRYIISVDFPGFQQSTRVVLLRAGNNRQVVVLAIQHVQESVTVAQEPQAAAADPRGAFGTTLTREQVDALSDDPDEMRRQLQELAGPTAAIRVDGVDGAMLPPKSQIKSIRIARDAFAAENHAAGGTFVDIVTQPGVGPIRSVFTARLRDGALSSRSPFTPIKGQEGAQDYGFNVGGALVDDKSAFALSAFGSTSYETPNLNVALPEGTVSEALGMRRPRAAFTVNGLFDYALTTDHALRIAFSQQGTTSKNLGTGAYDLAERAYSTEERFHAVRIQETGPAGRRSFMNTRASLSWSDSTSHSALEAPTVRVLDAFTSGGAQLAGGGRSTNVSLQSDLDYVRGAHSMRTGILVDAGWFRSDRASNYLGTYTFESLDAYRAGTPAGYTRMVGDPNVAFSMATLGAYVEDDVRLRKGLVLSPGLRYEVQEHVRDVRSLEPRVGLTWAPFKDGRTTLRASAGIFRDWLGVTTYEQTRRVDGVHQQELSVLDPSYPMPDGAGATSPSNRYLLDRQLLLPGTLRFSAGLEQKLSPRIRLGLLYAYVDGSSQLRGMNLNAPVAGIRPDAALGNIIEVVNDATSRQQTATATINIGPQAPLGNTSAGRRFDWKRTVLNASYSMGQKLADTGGDLSVPLVGSLAGEWGPAADDVRHRVSVSLNSQAVKNLSVNLNLVASSGTPYTMLTGVDDNGDLIFNDRPVGVGRNSLRGASQWTPSARFAYSIFPPREKRYHLQFVVNAQNLTNHVNYGGYSGTMTSPFFRTPTFVLNPRKIDLLVALGF